MENKVPNLHPRQASSQSAVGAGQREPGVVTGRLAGPRAAQGKRNQPPPRCSGRPTSARMGRPHFPARACENSRKQLMSASSTDIPNAHLVYLEM
eukprot:6826061-Alexandrium_andersonii.AAC.1